jgi:pimeloyl-ACP methyl ester carboxylesterase
MGCVTRRFPALAVAVVALAVALWATAASAGATTDHVQWMKGYDAPGTPAKYDKVGVLKIGPDNAKNILVFNPGTSAGSAYIAPFARTLARETHGQWQVWSVERRENLLEDQSVAEQAKEGLVTAKQLFDYYLGWLSDPSITNHFQLIPNSQVEFAKEWGMNVEINDLRKVVLAAEQTGRHVVMMGHSLGGSITTAYATWDFNGKPGVRGLSGLVYDDGGSSPTPITEQQAQQSLADLNSSSASPWLSFGGISAPFAGLFAEGGGISALIAPNQPSLGQQFPLLPANLKPPVPATNLAQFGYAADTQTSPPNLFAFQAHVGQLAASGDPRGWDQAGEITPIKRYAKMFAGWGFKNVDGVAWYHPMRLTIDAGAVGDGNPNPAQQVMGVRAIHGNAVNVPIYAFGAFGGQNVLDDAKALARQSRLPASKLTLVNRHNTYAHNDPAGAFPNNAFLNQLKPFLHNIARR